MSAGGGWFKNAKAITPHDTNTIGVPCKRIIAGAAGNINLVTAGGQTLIVAVAAGIPLDLEATIIKSTSTTATGIVVLY